MNREIKDIDDYVSLYPDNVKLMLEKIRQTIRKAAPKAEEVISYHMPAFKYHGVLVYFAAYKNHIGFYPTSSGIEAFKNELSTYKGAKGSVQFPLAGSIPLSLISKIVKFRVKENLVKAKLKGKSKTKGEKQNWVKMKKQALKIRGLLFLFSYENSLERF